MNEKEKVIGGVLNINQFFWILGGLAVGASIFAILYSLTQLAIFSLVIGFIFLFSGVPFALYKKKGLTLFQLLMYRRRFKKKVKKLPNLRKEVNL